MAPPIVAHAADYITLVPILIAVVALAVQTRRSKHQGDEPRSDDPDSMVGTALLGIRTLLDRYRRGPKGDARKK